MRRIAVDSDGALRYLLADGLGSTTAVTDAAGALTASSQQRYFPYGRARDQATVGLTVDQVPGSAVPRDFKEVIAWQSGTRYLPE